MPGPISQSYEHPDGPPPPKPSIPDPFWPGLDTWDILAAGEAKKPMLGMILRLANTYGAKFEVTLTEKQATDIGQGLCRSAKHVREGKIIPSADEFPERETIIIGDVEVPGVDPSSLQYETDSGIEIH